jgi:hypothetical protein
MRAIFEAMLNAERADVRDRVTLRDGSVMDLGITSFGEIYDTVLLLRVLMYLPASEPVIAGLAARVAPGGFLAVAARARRRLCQPRAIGSAGADGQHDIRLGQAQPGPLVLGGLFFDGVALLQVYILVVIVRDTSSRRSQRMSAPAGADPGVVRPTSHPNRGHHGSGVRHPARRGRGRR